MPRFRPTRTACILVFSAALTSVLFLYPSAISATIHHTLYPGEEYIPIDSLPPTLSPDTEGMIGAVRKHGRGRHWGWLSYLTPSRQEEGEGKDEGVNVVYADDGLVRGWDPREEISKTGYIKLSEGVRKHHPIHDLIARGQEKWAALLERYVPSPVPSLLFAVFSLLARTGRARAGSVG